VRGAIVSWCVVVVVVDGGVVVVVVEHPATPSQRQKLHTIK
jgi:hypothetical protein